MSGDEFTAKCEAAALELDALADQHGYPNNTRLRGKAQGVRLALSYLRDYPTAGAVLAVPAIADALAGCHAVTSDEGTSYCPLAEANAAAVARDAKVAEIVAEWLGSDNAPWPMTRALEHTIAIAALYGATRDHIAALRAVDDSDIVPGSEFDGPVIL